MRLESLTPWLCLLVDSCCRQVKHYATYSRRVVANREGWRFGQTANERSGPVRRCVGLRRPEQTLSPLSVRHSC